MKDQHRNQEALLQWEGLQSPCRITRLQHSGLLTGSSAATVSRDDSCRLRWEVEGFSSDPFAPTVEFQRKRTGPFGFSGASGGYAVSLFSCHLPQFQSKIDSDSGLYVQRAENSFKMGQNARTQEFFRELGVTPTVRQLESLKARNEQIHSRGHDKKPVKLWSFSENLRALFYKTMLRLLDYSGVYLDWAERKPAVKLLRSRRCRQGQAGIQDDV